MIINQLLLHVGAAASFHIKKDPLNNILMAIPWHVSVQCLTSKSSDGSKDVCHFLKA